MTTQHITRTVRSRERHNASRRGSATGGVPLSILLIIGLAVGVSLMFRVLTQKTITSPVADVTRVVKTVPVRYSGLTRFQQEPAMKVQLTNHTVFVLTIAHDPWAVRIRRGDRIAGYTNLDGSFVYTGIIAPSSTSQSTASAR